MNKTIVSLIVVAVVVLGGYFLFKGSYQPTPSVPQTSNQQAVPQPSVGQAPATEEKVVTYTDSGYSPSTITVKKGETVTFKNQSSNSMWTASGVHPTHRVYSGTSLSEHCGSSAENTSFDACKGILPNESWSCRFEQVGTLKYHNHLNPSDTGTIVVE